MFIPVRFRVVTPRDQERHAHEQPFADWQFARALARRGTAQMKADNRHRVPLQECRIEVFEVTLGTGTRFKGVREPQDGRSG